MSKKKQVYYPTIIINSNSFSTSINTHCNNLAMSNKVVLLYINNKPSYLYNPTLNTSLTCVRYNITKTGLAPFIQRKNGLYSLRQRTE